MLKKTVLWLVGVVAAFAVLVLVGRLTLQFHTESNRPDIDPDVGFDELTAIDVNGSTQWVQVRGVNRNNPTLLVLHGGPGAPLMPLGPAYQNRWEQQFNVVHWDQPGQGKTKATHFPDNPSFDDMLSDAIEVSAWARKRTGKDKIYLLGYSWGGMLGAPLVQLKPEWFHAFVVTGVLVDVWTNEMLGYAQTVDVAQSENHNQALAELRSLAPYPGTGGELSIESMRTLRKWQAELRIGLTRSHGGDSIAALLRQAFASPDYTWRDLSGLTSDPSAAWQTLNQEFRSYDVRRWGTSYQIPVIYMLGRHDWQTPSVIAERFFWEELEAPHKRLVWLEDSAHTTFIDEPDVFARELIAVKQLAPVPEPAAIE